MVNFYLDKIKNGIINPKTGNVWTVENVPTTWRFKVQEKLNNK